MRGSCWSFLAALVLGLVSTTPARLAEKTSQPDPLRLNNLGVAYMNQQRIEQALELFEQAYQFDPKLYTARLNQGIALLNLQRYEAAQQVLLEISQQQPQNIRAAYNLGLLYKNVGQTESALEAFERIAKLDPNDAETQYFRGLLLTQLLRFEAAIAAFEQALALNPFHASAEFGLARAYQRMGDSSRARQHLNRFQKLTQENLGTPMSLVYGEQGKYSLAEQVLPATGVVPEAIPVRFVSAASEAGLDFRHGAGSAAETSAASNLARVLGSGACFFDYDGDDRIDLFLVNSGEGAASALYQNQGKGRFIEVTRQAGLDARGYGTGCAAGDYDNDGWTDLAVAFLGRVALFRNQGNGTFRDHTPAARISVDGLPLGITFLDYDHDGDLDLYVTRFADFPAPDPRQPFAFSFEVSNAGNLLWRNNGNGTFTDWTEPTGLRSTTSSVAAVGTDFNNDRATDFILTGWQPAPLIFANPREGHFRGLEPWSEPMPSPAAGVAVLDFNKDGWMDLVLTHWGKPGVTLWQNREGKGFEPVTLPTRGWMRGWGVAVLDYDNDGWLDLAAVGEMEEKSEILLLRNRGPDGFEEVSTATALSQIELKAPRALITADYDQDGDTDLLVTQNSRPVVLLRNDGGNKSNWLRVRLKGLTDNKSAIGTKVEVFAGTLWQKWEVQAASGYLGQGATEIIAGLGHEPEAEIVRLRWPTGVLQDEVQLAARTSHSLSEIDRRGSSCPVLFAWNGERYIMVADSLGAGTIGHWVRPGERNVADPSEYVKVEARQVELRGGRLSFRFVEPMEETVYLDQVRLLAVDHPADTEVYPNEYFTLTGPPAPFRVNVSRDARPARGAWDEQRRDVLPELLYRDGWFLTRFNSLPFAGFAELHFLELDLGEWDSRQRLRLLLHGFIDYFSASSLYAADQADVHPISPYLEALDAQGRWVRVVDDIGFPAGLPRTTVADLTGRLPAGTRRVRLVTNLKIYWDQILVDNTPQTDGAQLLDIPLARATLSFLGFPRYVDMGPPGNVTYLYDDLSPTGPYAPFAGHYTSYGNVMPLLTRIDDRFVIFGPGEQIALEFDPASLPPSRESWVRDYFFFAHGFVKDMDFNSAHALTVGPLPFQGMGSYPYPPTRSYPDDEPHLSDLLDYNIRPTSGKEAGSFRFQFPPD